MNDKIKFRELATGNLVAASRADAAALRKIGTFGLPDFTPDGFACDGHEEAGPGMQYDTQYVGDIAEAAIIHGYGGIEIEHHAPAVDPADYYYDHAPAKAPAATPESEELRKAVSGYVGLHWQMEAGGGHSRTDRAGLRAAAVLNRNLGKAESRVERALTACKAAGVPGSLPIYHRGYVLSYDGHADIAVEKCTTVDARPLT